MHPASVLLARLLVHPRRHALLLALGERKPDYPPAVRQPLEVRQVDRPDHVVVARVGRHHRVDDLPIWIIFTTY